MDSQHHSLLYLLLLISSSIFCLHVTADASGSVFFLDSSVHQYLRSQSSQPKSLLLPDVGAAVSILLGFAPPSTLSSESSDKLNEVLMPNLFTRPRAVFMLEIDGVEAAEMQLGVGPNGNVFQKAFKARVSQGENDVDVQLSDEEEASVVSLNEPLPSYTEWTDKDLMDFAAWLDGSYVSNPVEPLSGELIIPLTNDVEITLHMSKKADREFTTSLVSLVYNVQRAVQMHGDLSGSTLSPAELIKGRFDGVKALQEQYGTDEIVRQGVELLVISLSKIYNALQTAYKGEIIGVYLLSGSPNEESETMLTVNFASRPSPRWLEETKDISDSVKIAEVLLVRRTLAWITGIILIISTLLGIYFLMYMSITRDTLLYSNVKLD